MLGSRQVLHRGCAAAPFTKGEGTACVLGEGLGVWRVQ